MRPTLRHKIGGSAAALVLATGALAGCQAGSAAVADPADGVDPEHAGEAPDRVHEGEFRQTLLMTGQLRAVRGEEITVPRMPDWETTIRWIIDDGAAVAEGDRLVELDTAQIASELQNKITARAQALNALEAKQSEIDAEVAQRGLAVVRAEVAARKAKIEASVPADVQSRQQHQAAQLALRQAQVEHEKTVADLEGYLRSSEAELGVLQVDLTQAEREVRQARDAIDTMVLRAPRAGIAVGSENRREQRKYQVGDLTSVGSTVVEIPDLTEMMVEAHLSDVDDGKIAAGMRVACRLDAYPARTFAGTVEAISPVAREAGFRSERRHFVVRVVLDESDPDVMRPGMSVKVEVETARRPRATLIPRSALRFLDDGSVAALLAGGDAVPVELGPCGAQVCVLRSGPPLGTELAGGG